MKYLILIIILLFLTGCSLFKPEIDKCILRCLDYKYSCEKLYYPNYTGIELVKGEATYYKCNNVTYNEAKTICFNDCS
jgi:hypothetical protein